MKRDINKILGTAIIALGTTGVLISNASASQIADGNYLMTINTTPELSPGVGDFGTNGNLNSGFFYGCLPGTSACGQMMTDTNSSGNAGEIGLSVSAGNITVTSFSVDDVFDTAGGTLSQYGDATNFSLASGTTSSLGLMTLTLTGRLADTSAAPITSGARFNVDDFTTPGNTTWTPFTTGVACNSLGCITGQDVAVAPSGIGGGINGGTDYTAIFVSAGILGNDWGAAAGTPYFEVWNSTSTITYVSALSSVPIPAAIWLFGSGLLGLIAFSRKTNWYT